MDPDLRTINDKNNSQNRSAAAAYTGLDSLLFNLLLDYNSKNRAKADVNLYFNLKLWVTVPAVGKTRILMIH
ncbi:hypothetical protein SCLARK_001749 [Spiroplasma clarkii]|uniref:hypothetical protein n=1 Tax=Spiroplasma clarkii TaxID=2139 RepID=UPI000B5652F7|nr:hypothetical protein [Spiroplasma clarkii]ARU92202.1 hypothetical protein SCLARK_001749 [Spiroplasma clarkii]